MSRRSKTDWVDALVVALAAIGMAGLGVLFLFALAEGLAP